MIFFSPRCLCALAAGTSCSRSFLQSPWHQTSGFTVLFLLCVAWNILSLFFLFFFSFKKITSSSKLFHWSLVLQLKMKRHSL